MDLIRIEIGFFKISRNELARRTMGTIFLVYYGVAVDLSQGAYLVLCRHLELHVCAGRDADSSHPMEQQDQRRQLSLLLDVHGECSNYLLVYLFHLFVVSLFIY